MKNIKKIIKYLQNIFNKYTHIFLLRIGFLDKIGLFAIGEMNKYCINPLFITIDVTDSDRILEFSHKNNRLPINDNEARILYSSHNLEHLTEEISDDFFKEAYRCLRPKGELSIEVPDCELLYNIFKKGAWENQIPKIKNPKSYHEYFCLSKEAINLVEKNQGEIVASNI